MTEITEEPIKHRDYESRRQEIKAAEKHLFELKAEFESLRFLRGKIKIAAPSSYRCTTCGAVECLNHDLQGAEGRIIRNQTAMNGCLAWLPLERGA